MKFGNTLAETLVPEWRQYYINYEGLKQRLKQVRLAEGMKLFQAGEESGYRTTGHHHTLYSAPAVSLKSPSQV